ncbi:SOS response-associated peptidase [Smaragdicoccus niigatensis]|uniref:SOS response-associated peptidase n=1 Tax=Smaragdicoccus niigatensis TaxID=359359 RepID=UPI000380C945|nr:SOS response-associated peptidase [Smaragdicoccus niigatensis]
MCGRYATTVGPADLAAELDALDETDPTETLLDVEAGPNYNVAPTTKVLAVVDRHDRDHPDDPASRRIRRMRWGLIPHWTKESSPGVPERGKPLFNARAEAAATTAAFRDSFTSRRCLVPMDGWFEWTVSNSGTKTPHYMHRADGGRLYAAGLWSVWRGGAGTKPVLSCTILTTDAVDRLTAVHNRMPLLLAESEWAAWLDPDHRPEKRLVAGIDPELVAQIEIRDVSPAVNSVKNNSPDLLLPADDAGHDTLF